MSKNLTLYQPEEETRKRSLSGVPLASFTRRATALFIDFCAAGLMFLLVLIGGGILLQKLGLLNLDEKVNLQLTFFGNWYSLIWLVLYFGLSVYFTNGKTLGKKMMKIRVVSLKHEKIGFWHSIERALGYGASALELGLGFLQYFWNSDRRTVHDRIAETIVVSESVESKTGD